MLKNRCSCPEKKEKLIKREQLSEEHNILKRLYGPDNNKIVSHSLLETTRGPFGGLRIKKVRMK